MIKPPVHVLFKFASNPYGGVEIDTTSSSGEFRELSPFILGPINTYVEGLQSQNFENLWQFSKVYHEHLDSNGEPNLEWYAWRNAGWRDKKAHRYPMGKGRIPAYSYWDGRKLGYIEARKEIYIPIYAEYVIYTASFHKLKQIYDSGKTLILRDYDAYDHIVAGMTLVDVVNNPRRKCGHAFVLAMILTGVYVDQR